uniref:Uncharacterized protein n=1 Tax=Trichogramma kaykai TaxID=54128 RepID=A0ABD2VUQ8_9HYME
MLTAELQAIAKPTIPPRPLPGRKRPEISQICNRPIVDAAAAAAAADISGLWSGVKRLVFSSQTILSRSGSERAQFSSSFASIAYSPSRAYFLCAAILLLPTRAKLSSQSKPKRAPNSVRSYPRPREQYNAVTNDSLCVIEYCRKLEVCERHVQPQEKERPFIRKKPFANYGPSRMFQKQLCATFFSLPPPPLPPPELWQALGSG